MNEQQRKSTAQNRQTKEEKIWWNLLKLVYCKPESCFHHAFFEWVKNAKSKLIVMMKRNLNFQMNQYVRIKKI